MMKRITNMVNLTPYTIQFIDGDDDVLVTIKPSRKNVGEVEGLPEPREGTIYIVSPSLVAERIDRKDVFIPTPNKSVRDENRMMIRCRSIRRI